MSAAIIEPIILYDDEYPPTGLVAPLEAALLSVSKWFETKGIYVHFATVKTPRYDHNIDILTSENPWAQVRDEVPKLGYPVDHKSLVLLRGWYVNHTAYGWGGNPLALVSGRTLDWLASHGTAEGIMDDNLVAGLIAHEVGHVLGYQHSTEPGPNVMWHWWLYPEVYFSLDQRASGSFGGAPSACAPLP